MVRATEEQQLAIEKFLTRRPLKIAAFAGAGKTTTLRMLAEATRSRGVYLAFNKAIATQAKQKFPKSIDCRTTHAFAFKAVMPQYGSAAKLTKKLYAKQLAAISAYPDRIFQTFRLDDIHHAHLVLGTLRQFCQSSDPEIGLQHVPTYRRLLGAKEDVVSEIRAWTVAEAALLWCRMIDKNDDLPLGHDGYLKLWALSQPVFNAEYILLDEAQDTNAVVLGVLEAQRAQVVYVGDKHQQIYEWRGAINAMENIQGCEDATLTQSFRFGADIAETASRVLATLGEPLRIRGNPEVHSTISASGRADAVLARTNATVVMEVLEATRLGQSPYICGGIAEIKNLLRDVYELKAGRPVVSPEFFGFQNWIEVVEFANSEEGEGLRTFVQLVEQHGVDKLWAAVNKAVADENAADVILSTAHKAKGREWNSVRLASDFTNSRLGPDAVSEVRLFYVAMTRAKTQLVADPELLRTFTTDGWKSRQAILQPRGTSTPPIEIPRTRKTNPASVRTQGLRMNGKPPPILAPSRLSPGSPRVPVLSGRDEIAEITPRAVVPEIPGPAASGNAKVNSDNKVAVNSTAASNKFWDRVARFFGA